MTIEEAIVQKLRGLPPERQREVLDFVEFLETRSGRAAALERMRSADQKRS